MLDPIADKVLVATALMMLVAGGAFDGYKLVPALVILAREILVSGLREFLAGVRVSVPVTSIAKIKTTIQMIAIGAMILGPTADHVIPGALAFAYIALWVAAGLTVYTGYVYFRAGLVHVRPDRDTSGGPRRRHDAALFRLGATEARARARKRSTLPPNIHRPCANLPAFSPRAAAAMKTCSTTKRRLRVAVNQEHADWDAAVAGADEVAFFPPVTGG